MVHFFRFDRRHLLILAVLPALILLATSPLEAATPLPPFKLAAVNGGTIDSGSYRGKVLLINFFATWCPACRREIPSLEKLQEEFGSKGFSVIGIAMDQDGPEIVKRFIEKVKINYPVGLGTEQVAMEFGGVIGIPTSFLVDREGNVVKTYPGYADDAVLKDDIKGLL